MKNKIYKNQTEVTKFRPLNLNLLRKCFTFNFYFSLLLCVLYFHLSLTYLSPYFFTRFNLQLAGPTKFTSVRFFLFHSITCLSYLKILLLTTLAFCSVLFGSPSLHCMPHGICFTNSLGTGETRPSSLTSKKYLAAAL